MSGWKTASWLERLANLPDARLVQAEREIRAAYGDEVSIRAKSKSLIKFGFNLDSLSGTRETVWSVGGNETYLTANLIDSVSSSDPADTQPVTVEMHELSGSGLNERFTFFTQTVTLDGQNRVPLPRAGARCSRMFNADGSELVGRVVAYENTALTNGVPTDVTKIHNEIPAGFQQSFKAATTFSDNDYFILTNGYGSVGNKNVAFVDYYLEVKLPGRTFREQSAISASSNGGAWQITLDPCVIIPRNADVRVRSSSSAAGAEVFANFGGYIAARI